jgi:dTDP-4-amino-4,6-dideoxygalactose transaminase
MSNPTSPPVPFNRPGLKGRELEYIRQALEARHLSGDGPFTKKCHSWLERELSTPTALLTHSCTAALEMSMLLDDLAPGDEVIMPSFTFVSTANAVALRGAVPVFVDIRPDTLNIDEKLIEAAITSRTRAIMVVHYAGVSCEMDTILEIARRRNLMVCEDAAQGLLAFYKGRALGTIGDLGCISFHETKNIVSGEGGALLINNDRFKLRAEVIREKGTNRSQFFRGQVDKYTWVDIGSSYLPSEVLAAMLFAQLEAAREITAERVAVWNKYHAAFAPLGERVVRPTVPAECVHNGHLYYLLTSSLEERTAMLAFLKSRGIGSVFHYVPLHSAPAGVKYGRMHGSLSHTDSCSERLLRLPMWSGLEPQSVDRVIETVFEFFKQR